jgi:hypothetical protein
LHSARLRDQHPQDLSERCEPPERFVRYACMELPSDTQIKLRIGYALSDRLAPLVSSIQQNITNSTKLISDLPSVAIEALLDFSKEQHRNDHARTELDKAYKEIRAAYLKYAEIALREARERERRLFYGITGVASVEDFGAPTAPISPDG